MKHSLIFTCFALALGSVTPAPGVTFDWAQIGNAGNAGDGTGSGAVAYNYAISKTEVTNAQYTDFLNAVAVSDPYGLYETSMGIFSQAGITRSGSSGSYSYTVKADAVGQGPNGTDYSYDDKPVIYVSWYDSVRFINWLHNGQGLAGTPSGDTETGAYTLLGGTETPTNGLAITRNLDAIYWLPSEDEWYKAAYHDASAGTAGIYFDFATRSNVDPDNNLPSSDTGNSANYFDVGYTNNSSYPLTEVGGYHLSRSPYGTYDQSGNVWEWNETLVRSPVRGLHGGSWFNSEVDRSASNRNLSVPWAESSSVGFRIGTIPEPTSLLLLVCFAGGMLLQRRR